MGVPAVRRRGRGTRSGPCSSLPDTSLERQEVLRDEIGNRGTVFGRKDFDKVNEILVQAKIQTGFRHLCPL